MTDFTHGDFVYLNDIDDTPKHYHKIFIHKEKPGITITSPKKLKEK